MSNSDAQAQAGAPFQLGSCDTFRLQTRDVGDISQIEFGHDGSGLDAGWGMDSVTMSCDKGVCCSFAGHGLVTLRDRLSRSTLPAQAHSLKEPSLVPN